MSERKAMRISEGGVVQLQMVTRPDRVLRLTGHARLPVLVDGRAVELDVIVAAGPNGGRYLISDDPALGPLLQAAS